MAAENTDRNKLNRYDATPLYAQLRSIFREKISSGEWAPNTMIPSENELSRIYGISRMTVRNVITQFVTEGMLYRIQGKGTFVNDTKLEISSLQYVGIRSQLEEMGQSVTTRLITCGIIHADEYLARKLNIRAGDELYRLKRVRSVNGRPISYHKSFVPVGLCPDLDKKDLEGEQLCAIMSNDYLLTRSRVIETLESYTASTSKAKHLDVEPGFPLILLQDQIYSKDNTLFEYTRVYFRGDRVKIRIQYDS